jgi:hypothetical protein
VTVQDPCDPIKKNSTLSNFDQSHCYVYRMVRFDARRSAIPQILALAAGMYQARATICRRLHVLVPWPVHEHHHIPIIRIMSSYPTQLETIEPQG